MTQMAWLREKPLERLEKVEIDPGWTSRLPRGSTVLSTEGVFGSSFWTQTARVNVALESGEEKPFFFKQAINDIGLLMIRGEYYSMAALHEVSPEFTPRPYGWGSFESDPNKHFFLCECVDLVDEMPDPKLLGRKLADLHRRSQDYSPNGQFGFDITTCNKTFIQDNKWCTSWEAFYLQQLKAAFNLELEVQGPCPDYDTLLPTLFEKVVPRLLRPLETGGNTVKPSLIHGDLWEGNVAVLRRNEQPYIFAASAFWGHNEYDLHCWRAARFRLGKTFVKEYFHNFPISPPVDDWDDRNLLYSLRADLHDSILFASTPRFRVLILKTLKELIAKFSNGYEGSHCRKDTETEIQALETNEVDEGVIVTMTGSSESTFQQVPFVEEYQMLDQRVRWQEMHNEDANTPSNVVNTADSELASDHKDHVTHIEPRPEDTFIRVFDHDEGAANTPKFGTRHHGEQGPAALHQWKTSSEIGVGESALSPPNGSVAGGS